MSQTTSRQIKNLAVTTIVVSILATWSVILPAINTGLEIRETNIPTKKI
jgi:hypothetical protein